MQELKEKLEKALKTKYGIETRADLERALDELTELDLGIFVTPRKKENIA